MAESKLTLVEPDALNRCQAVHKTGQCRYESTPNSKFCPMHGGNKGEAAVKAQMLKQYQLAKWQQRVVEFADDDEVKSLRGEVGITRLLLEETVGRCKDSGELLLASARISDLIGRVERLVVSCHRLESNLGLMLDKPKVLSIAAQIIEIIGELVEDESVVAAISQRIVDMIASTEGRKSDSKS